MNNKITNVKQIVAGLVFVPLITATQLVSNPAQAAEVEANVAIATDYVFRGFSQTTEDPAISGGLDYAFDSGLYIGTWTSNVNFGNDTSQELDLYVGYAFDVSDNVGLDFTFTHYIYPGETDLLNYSEASVAVSLGSLGLGVVFSPDYFGSDADSFIFNADYSFTLTEKLSLDLHAGYTSTDDGVVFAGDNYVDYSAALSTSTSGLDIALTFYGTDVDDNDSGDDRLVFSVGKSF